MPSDERFRLCLAKEDFKFSVAHFTVFSPERAELLHGHNYRVTVEIAGREVGELGLLADLDRVKQEIRRLCRELDSRTLLPAACPLLTWEHRDGGIEVTYHDRRYRIPEADVLLLPLANSSMELLARHLWRQLAPSLEGTAVEHLTVTVEEAQGQRAVYERSLEPPV
ncbi:MAG TPA: 6-carboxytetrahydropterin synthase [Thermoanaerobaculia bacterium]|nr:6-carboxytetrahydropterin synthase [Thermoanaerobaculia bacterium]